MGASKEKQIRARERQEGPTAKERAALEQQKKERRRRARYIIVGVIIVLLAALVIFVNSRLFVDGLTALKVNDTNYTVADVNYYYQTAYMSYSQSTSSYLSYFLDTSLPLDEQIYPLDDTGRTWAEYFEDVAEANMRDMTALYDAAIAEGYTLTEEGQANIDSAISNYELYASGYGSLDAFLAVNFGPGNNEANVRENMARDEIVSQYLSDLYDSFTYTDEEKDAYYQENAASYDQVEYAYAYLSGSADEEAGIDQETAMATAAGNAQTILDTWDGGDLEAFQAAVEEVTGGAPTETSLAQSSFLSQFDGSVTQEDLADGYVFSHESSAGWYVVYVQGVQTCDYPTVNVRHILVKVEDTDGDGTYSDEEKQAAYDEIVALRDEWLAGDPTEDSFAALATLKSEDTASTEAGGLYEDIHRGEMVEEFDAFCFAGHEPGDYDIVYGESSAYAGYHLVYFVGEGELYSRQLADSALRQEDYTAACEAVTEPYTSQRTFMFRYVMS